MTSSERKARANRQNARLSTGPRTARGRARSSRNATKHGLNTPPHPALVARVYRYIMEDGDARDGPGVSDAQARAGWALAEAEVRVGRVRAQITTRLERYRDEVGEPNRGYRMYADLDHLHSLLPGVFDRTTAKALKSMMRMIREKYREMQRDLRVLDRYLAEAEAKRRKALKLWIMASVQNPETKPNYTQK